MQNENPNEESANAGLNPQQPKLNASSIYPGATAGANTFSSPFTDVPQDKKAATEVFSFSNGYSIGGSIFWLQLLAAIVLGLILNGAIQSVLKTHSTSLVALVSILYYLFELTILIYIPYNTLKSNNVEEPFWLTLFGAATQAIVVFGSFELIVLLILRTIINHGTSSALPHLGASGVVATGIIFWLGLLIVSYFLTKLSWGTAFALRAKIKSGLVVKAIGIGVIAFIVGSIAYHYLTLHRPVYSKRQTPNNLAQITRGGSTEKREPPKTVTPPTLYTNQTVLGHGFNVTLDFDPNAYATLNYKPSRQLANGQYTQETNVVDVIGNELNNAKQMVVGVTKIGPSLAPAQINPAKCLGPFKPGDSRPSTNHGDELLFNATVDGKSYAVCTNSMSDIVSSGDMYVLENGTYYLVQFANFTGTAIGIWNGQTTATPLDTNSIKVVANSIKLR